MTCSNCTRSDCIGLKKSNASWYCPYQKEFVTSPSIGSVPRYSTFSQYSSSSTTSSTKIQSN